MSTPSLRARTRGGCHWKAIGFDIEGDSPDPYASSSGSLEADGSGESKAISKTTAFQKTDRPPGLRRSSKESKVPNKRERDNVGVYVEVARAQHPAPEPELEADGLAKYITESMAFKKQATTLTTLFEVTFEGNARPDCCSMPGML